MSAIGSVLLLMGCTNSDAKKPPLYSVSEAFLRARATKTVAPQFPMGCVLTAHLSVGVVQISFDEKGGVQAVDVVEAPCSQASVSLKTAISQWQFAFDFPPKKAIVRGKLTFYFQIDANGRGRVTAPESTQLWGDVET